MPSMAGSVSDERWPRRRTLAAAGSRAGSPAPTERAGGVVQAEQLRGELVGPLFHCQVGRIARGGLRFELDDRRGRRPATRRHLALPARGHVRLTARVPLPGCPRPALRQQHQLESVGLTLLRHGGQLSREDAPEGLGYPALREPDFGGDLALAPALDDQVQDAFIATQLVPAR